MPLTVNVRMLPAVPEVDVLPVSVKVAGTHGGSGGTQSTSSFFSLNASSGVVSDVEAAMTSTLPDWPLPLNVAQRAAVLVVSLSSFGQTCCEQRVAQRQVVVERIGLGADPHRDVAVGADVSRGTPGRR